MEFDLKFFKLYRKETDQNLFGFPFNVMVEGGRRGMRLIGDLS